MNLKEKAERLIFEYGTYNKFPYYFVGSPEINEVLGATMDLARAYLRCREALEYYTNPELYLEDYPPIKEDGGERARKALEEM